MKKIFFVFVVFSILTLKSYASTKPKVQKPLNQAVNEILTKIKTHFPNIDPNCRVHIKFTIEGHVYYVDTTECEGVNQRLALVAIVKASPFNSYPPEIHQYVGDIKIVIGAPNPRKSNFSN